MAIRSKRPAAIACLAALLCTSALTAGAQQAPASPPTPQTADGHPDLSGFWGAGGGPAGGGAFARGPTAPTGGESGQQNYISPMNLRNGDISNLTNDGVIGRRSTNNLPLYKPQYWEKVEDLDWNGNKLDPYNHCMPPSVPRIGAPRKIVQLPNEIILFYSVIFQRNDFRIIPIGPRTKQPDRDGAWYGEPVAHWDGDTLVVETIGFNTESWLGPQGYLHGYDLKVTERFRRQGNRLVYQSIVEDPEYLQKPWVRDPVNLSLQTGPNLSLDEAAPCADRDVHNQVGKQREM